MPLTLFINKMCPFSHRAYIAAVEKGLVENGTVEIVEVPLPTPEWFNTEINPRQALPALRLENGLVIPESLVVVQYLDEAFPSNIALMPKDPKDRADIRVFIADFDTLVSGLQKVKFEKDESKRAPLIQSSKEDIAFIERALEAKSKGPYFLGEQFSLADIAILPVTDRNRYTLPEFFGFDFLAEAPRLAALISAAETRSSFRDTTQSKEAYLAYFKKVLQTH